MESKNKDAMIGCVVYLALLPVMAVLNGYALSMLWQWFIVTTFEARPLNVLQAIGVAVVVGFLTKQIDRYTDDSKTSTERTIESIVYGLVNPVFALAFGWILHSFM